ncbi:MAG: c-type cytochrome [Pseudomonadota bacterium]
MKNALSVLLCALASTVFAADEAPAELAKTLRCYSCHDVNEPLIGPPYKAIAARHAANKDVMVEVLAHKIVQGGGGTWGVVPMVPNEHVSEEQARTLARWILSQ